MIKQNDNSKKTSLTNIKLIKNDSKKYLYTSPYENVVKVLNALKDYLSTINNKNNDKALEELDWVINIITNNLLYYYQKTLFYKKNTDLINGSHKFLDFSNEVEKFNKDNEDFCKKYIQLRIKNEEFSKSLGFIEKNISFISNSKNKINSSFNYDEKIKQVEMMNNKRKINNSSILSQLPIHIFNDYNKNPYENNSISKIIYSTDIRSIKNKNNSLNNPSILNKKNKVRELPTDPQTSSKNISNNKKQIYNNYRIFSSSNTNNKNKNNLSFPKQRKNIKIFGENNYLNYNNNQQLEKIISLPIIQFNFNGGINIDKYKINLFNRRNNVNIKNKKFEEEQSNKKLLIFGEEICNNIPKLPLYLKSGIDLNLIFDFQNFDIFILKEKIGLENVMPFLGKEIIKKENIIHLFDESKLDNFLMVLSKAYQNTKALYHTSLHGADVCYSSLIVLTYLEDENKKIKNISELDIVSIIVSTLAHDVGHPGLTNKFLINSKNELSIIYNDQSVLENFHCAKTFKLLENNDVNIFSNFSNEDFLSLRKKIIREILSTDMSNHFKVLEEYQQYKISGDEKLGQNQLNFIIHISDLFHNFRKIEISLKWVEALSNEFWNQGDKEKELGLSVSFLCDREDIDVPKSQISFIKTFSIPTIQELVEVNAKFDQLKNNTINNLNFWEKCQKEKRKRGWTPDKK